MKVDFPLNKQVFLKNEFYNTVNTNFSQLVDVPISTIFDINQATLEDFFELYSKFFFEIPKEGIINSHEYLIKESGDYVGFNKDNTEIQALLEEITSLREENLNLINAIDSISQELAKIPRQ